jgi:2-iminobutanoate/2-iminopropanoate deaminase
VTFPDPNLKDHIEHVYSGCQLHRFAPLVKPGGVVVALLLKETPKDPPARIFVIPAWNGRFDIEVDCIAAV